MSRTADSTNSSRPVALITGAGSGIGLGCALKLAEAGMAIVGVGRDPEKLAALSAAIGDPDRVETVAVDITQTDAPTQIVQAAVRRWSRIDFLINNAGIGKPKPLHLTDDATLDYFLDVMLRAPFRLSREALPHMPPGSAMINITSTYAILGGLSGGAYSAAKAGMSGLTRHIACQYGALGVRANEVAPGVIPTSMTEGREQNEAAVRLNEEMTPHTRMGTVDDVASVVAFLCSPGGSFINGQTIAVDGGWTTTKFLSDFARTATWSAKS